MTDLQDEIRQLQGEVESQIKALLERIERADDLIRVALAHINGDPTYSSRKIVCQYLETYLFSTSSALSSPELS